MNSKKQNLIEKFLALESEFFDFNIKGVYLWKYLRELCYETFISKNFNVSPRVSVQKNKWSKFVFFIKQIPYLLKPLKINKKNIDILCCVFPRKTKYKDKYVSTQLDEIISMFSSVCTIEYPFWIEDESYFVSHFSNDSNILTDAIELKAMFLCKIKSIFKPIFIIIHRKLIDDLHKRICDLLGVQINKTTLINNIFFYYHYEKYVYKKLKKLIEKINPKVFVEVYTPNRQLAVLNTVCHDLSIPKIDIQHGALFTYEPIMYSYQKKKMYSHLSNYIFSLGEYWKRKFNFHLPNENIIVTGCPFLEKYTEENKIISNGKILIISQTRYHKFFMDLAIQLRSLTEYEIEIKLHPYENAYYKNGEYTKLEEKGIKVKYGMENSIYDCLKNAHAVVGICSTALFEALAFKIPVFFYDGSYGSEELEKMQNYFPVYSFTNINELIKKLDENKVCDFTNNEWLFANNSRQKIKKELEKIILRESK